MAVNNWAHAIQMQYRSILCLHKVEVTIICNMPEDGPEDNESPAQYVSKHTSASLSCSVAFLSIWSKSYLFQDASNLYVVNMLFEFWTICSSLILDSYLQKTFKLIANRIVLLHQYVYSVSTLAEMIKVLDFSSTW
jgi:hypothetical protein